MATFVSDSWAKGIERDGKGELVALKVFGWCLNSGLHPWRLTWNIIMEVWKIIFLSKWVICRFHVNLPGCNKAFFKGKPNGSKYQLGTLKIIAQIAHVQWFSPKISLILVAIQARRWFKVTLFPAYQAAALNSCWFVEIRLIGFQSRFADRCFLRFLWECSKGSEGLLTQTLKLRAGFFLKGASDLELGWQTASGNDHVSHLKVAGSRWFSDLP